jgi:hypothetical protein
VVLLDVHLHNPATERMSIETAAAVNEWYILPAYGPNEWDIGELDQVVVPCAGVEDDVCRCVGLILLVVDVEPNSPDFHAAEKVNC